MLYFIPWYSILPKQRRCFGTEHTRQHAEFGNQGMPKLIMYKHNNIGEQDHEKNTSNFTVRRLRTKTNSLSFRLY